MTLEALFEEFISVLVHLYKQSVKIGHNVLYNLKEFSHINFLQVF